jgi:hypothetical protein
MINFVLNFFIFSSLRKLGNEELLVLCTVSTVELIETISKWNIDVLYNHNYIL